MTIETLDFPQGRQARVILVPRDSFVTPIIDALALPRPKAVLVLNGGTAGIAASFQQQLRRHLSEGIARLAFDKEITIVTGGTNAGVFALLGQGMKQWGNSAPVIGVTVASLVQRSGNESGAVDLESHHSHFILVSGTHWGDETQLMYSLVAELARGCPSVAVFANGGKIVLNEMEANIAQRRPLILLGGSGRSTDAVLAAQSGQPTDDARIKTIGSSEFIHPFDISQEPQALYDLVWRTLVDQAASLE